MENKPKAIVFFQYLPPWRIDVFNEMAKYYNLTIVYTDAEIEGFKYDRNDLLSRLDKSISNVFLNNGFKIGQRPVRFGIYKLIKKIDPDIIFSHEYSPTSIIVATFKNLSILKFQFVITTSDNLSIAKSIKGVKAFFRKYVLSAAKTVVVYSNAVKEFYEHTFNNLSVEICPNIQNPNSLLKYRESFQPIIDNYKNNYNLNGYKVALYTGRLRVGIKGLDLLLNAFSKIDNNEYKLVLVGDGNEKEELERICKSLAIEDKVIFTGFCSGTDLYAWYDLANFYVLPSRFEPFGAVVNEALVFGLPVLASKYIGAVDFISETNGKLFDPLKENEFVKELNSFTSNTRYVIGDERKDIMPVSFEEYVKVFFQIFNK